MMSSKIGNFEVCVLYGIINGNSFLLYGSEAIHVQC